MRSWRARRVPCPRPGVGMSLTPLLCVVVLCVFPESGSAQSISASSGHWSDLRTDAGAPVRVTPTSIFSGSAPQTPHPAVVRVISPERNGASLGSGTLVDVTEKHGLVLTCWHVVKDAAGNVIISFPDGFQTPGYVIKMDRDWDLAAVAIWRPRRSPARCISPRIGYLEGSKELPKWQR